MRGSLRKNFWLNSVHQFGQYTVRFLRFFNIFISSDFAHIPNLSFLMDINFNGETFVNIFFHLREISKQTLGNIKKTALILSSESVNMLIRGVVAAVRVVRNHSKSTSIVFFLYLQQFVSTPLSLLCASKVAKSPNLFILECSFHWWKPFCSIYDSLRENGRQHSGSN